LGTHIAAVFSARGNCQLQGHLRTGSQALFLGQNPARSFPCGLEPLTDGNRPFVAKITKARCAEPDKTVYFGGDILKMVANTPTYAEAVVKPGGRIAFVGSKSEALQRFGEAQQIDLQG
jgi:hypothetical protein